jgi:hypothetical protein
MVYDYNGIHFYWYIFYCKDAAVKRRKVDKQENDAYKVVLGNKGNNDNKFMPLSAFLAQQGLAFRIQPSCYTLAAGRRHCFGVGIGSVVSMKGMPDMA